MSSYPGLLPGWIIFNLDEPHPEPLSFHAGDSLKWDRAFEQYPATGGWTLQYVLNNPTNKYVVASGDITTQTEDGEAGFSIAVPSAETKGWAPGYYLWLAVLSNPGTGERVTGAAGRVQILADILDASSPIDTRSIEEVSLDNIRIMLSGRATDGVQEYKIADRELRRYTVAELLKLKSHYENEVKKIRVRRGEYFQPDTVAFHAGGGING